MLIQGQALVYILEAQLLLPCQLLNNLQVALQCTELLVNLYRADQAAKYLKLFTNGHSGKGDILNNMWNLMVYLNHVAIFFR